jgi:hypothetical protein
MLALNQIPILILLPVMIWHTNPAKEPVSKPAAKKIEVVKWAVQKSSKLDIMGSSNVNNFGCSLMGYSKQDTIFCAVEQPGKPVLLKGGLTINIANFDCHSRMITNDLRKTLKVAEYPTLYIKFLTLDRMPCNLKDEIKGWVEVQLAGRTKTVELSYTFDQTESPCIRLNGTKSFTFSDFKLEPPTKMAGMIKVRDKFDVDFRLVLYPL